MQPQLYQLSAPFKTGNTSHRAAGLVALGQLNDLGKKLASVDLLTLDHRLLVLALMDTGTLLGYFGWKYVAEWRCDKSDEPSEPVKVYATTV